MGWWGGCDIYEIEFFMLKQFASICVGPSTELIRGRGRFVQIYVAGRDEFYLGHLSPCMEMILGKETRADHGESVWAAHSSTGLRGSVIHSLHEPTYMREPVRPAWVIAKTFWAAVTPEPQ